MKQAHRVFLAVALLVSGCDSGARFEPIDRSWHTGTVTVEPYRSGKERGVKVTGQWPDASEDLWIRHSLWLTQEGGEEVFLASSDQKLANFRDSGTSDYSRSDYRRHIDPSRAYRAVFDYELWKGVPGAGKLLKKDSVYSEPIEELAKETAVGENKESAGTISKAKAIAIANAHFGRAADASCYVEARGDYFFVAPPYIREADSERAGVYIDKATGELFESKPPE